MNCPKCQHPHFVKNGFVNSTQRYMCKACDYQWTRTTPRGHPATHKRLTVLLYRHGISMHAISQLFNGNVFDIVNLGGGQFPNIIS